MTIEMELKEIKTHVKESEEVDIKLLKKIVKFLGSENNPARGKISLSNRNEINNIKKNFIINLLGESDENAKKIIKNVKSILKNLHSTYRAIFYYYIIKEINSPKTKIPNIHPGEILLEEFLIPMNISAYKLSKDIGVPQTRISMILKKERSITADTALRLSKYFGNSSKFWLGLQNDYDLEESKKNNLLDLIQIRNCA
jgi:addiction module antidote protein, HigA family